ncbi:MAG: hypothetical protein EOP48_01115 [Sphingobacteriales bacterium]|nr:MAG: hypothetical protein EOP48_01115 [Sphingobacteriales bacterium]
MAKTIISSIINDLQDTEKSMTDIMLRVRVLADDINAPELVEWVKAELNGYNQSEVPEYRIINGHVKGTIIQGVHSMSNVSIPYSHLGPELMREFSTFTINHSIGYIEHVLKQEDLTQLNYPWPAEVCGYLSSQMKKIGNPMRVLDARIIGDKNGLQNIISVIRSKMLELMLELRRNLKNLDKWNEEDTELDIAPIQSTVQKFITQMHITNYGHGAVFNSGDKNKFDIENQAD